MRITLNTGGALLALMARLITATRYVVEGDMHTIHKGFGKTPIPLSAKKFR